MEASDPRNRVFGLEYLSARAGMMASRFFAMLLVPEARWGTELARRDALELKRMLELVYAEAEPDDLLERKIADCRADLVSNLDKECKNSLARFSACEMGDLLGRFASGQTPTSDELIDARFFLQCLRFAIIREVRYIEGETPSHK